MPMEEGPNSVVRGTTAFGTIMCNQLLTTGTIRYDHCIKAFRTAKGRVAAPSYVETGPLFDISAEMFEALCRQKYCFTPRAMRLHYIWDIRLRRFHPRNSTSGLRGIDVQ